MNQITGTGHWEILTPADFSVYPMFIAVKRLHFVINCLESRKYKRRFYQNETTYSLFGKRFKRYIHRDNECTYLNLMDKNDRYSVCI